MSSPSRNTSRRTAPSRSPRTVTAFICARPRRLRSPASATCRTIPFSACGFPTPPSRTATAQDGISTVARRSSAPCSARRRNNGIPPPTKQPRPMTARESATIGMPATEIYCNRKKRNQKPPQPKKRHAFSVSLLSCNRLSAKATSLPRHDCPAVASSAIRRSSSPYTSTPKAVFAFRSVSVQSASA